MLPCCSLGRVFAGHGNVHTVGLHRFPIGGREAVVTEEAKRMLSRTKELCYLTSFVFRLYEDAEKVCCSIAPAGD